MRVRKLSTLVLASLAAALVAGCGPAGSAASTSAEALHASAASGVMAGGNKRVTVMSRNLYLGADLLPIAAAVTQAPDDLKLQAFVGAVTAAWQQIQENDFTVRAEALASEIAASRPDLVGLQEVYTFRTDTPADGPATPAEVVAYDFLGTLLAELAERGLAYRPVAVVELSDIEAPTALGYDVRLTDHGVVLASDRVAQTALVAEGVYAAKIPFPAPSGAFDVERGFTVVDAKIRGEWIRFANTHLEAYNVPAGTGAPPGYFRLLQAAELAVFLAQAPGADLPTILVGDLNSDPGEEGHAVLAAAGFEDLWAEAGIGPGFTSGFPEDLSLDGALTRRIDYVLHRGLVEPLAADVVGETAAEKAITGLWPSDHAGVVGTLRILDGRFAAP
jgi:endonuclease/exonuclease/phosphatase family metal-dependent hydrolase